MIEYLVAVPFELWMVYVQYFCYFAILITVVAEIVIEKCYVYVVKGVVDSEARNFLITGFYRQGL